MNIDDFEDYPEMTWEQHAREAIEEAISHVKKDDIRGVMYLMSGRDHNFNRIQEEFTDYDSLYYKLIEIGEEEWVSYAPFDGGEPVFEPSVEDYVHSAIEEIKAEEFFFSNKAPEEAGDKIADAYDLLSPEEAWQLRVVVTEVNEELIRYLAKHPEKLQELNPRKFEELVAELFKDMGYEVELTPVSKDGGFDIRAVKKTDVGCGLTLIECKRYKTTNKVGVEVVRGLYGVVEQKSATSGLIVTTSYFTKGAVTYQKDLQYRLSLADQCRLRKYLANYRKEQK